VKRISGFVLAMLAAVGIAAGMLGYVTAKELTAPLGREDPRIAVVTLPATPSPSATPSVTATASEFRAPDSTRVEIDGRRVGEPDGGSDGCPAGCTCETRPPAGVVIVCR
jgi:hypothetical protein